MRLAPGKEVDALADLAAPLVKAAHESAVRNVRPEFQNRQTIMAALTSVVNANTTRDPETQIGEAIAAMAVSMASLVVQGGADPISGLATFGRQYMASVAEQSAALTPQSGARN